MDKSKRRLLKTIGAGTLYFPFTNLPILNTVANSNGEGYLFYQVFSEVAMRTAFGNRLEAIHLSYIDPTILSLIEMSLQDVYTDQEVYEKVQYSLNTNTIYTSATNAQIHGAAYAQEQLTNTLRKSVSLLHQMELNDGFQGHLDIGSGQICIDRLWEEFPLNGQSISMSGTRRVGSKSDPTFDPILDMLCSEQLTSIDETIDLDRQSIGSIETESMSLITAFRGLNQYEGYLVDSLLRRLKRGGHLILQEEDVNTKENHQLARLSQYVDNLQAGISWNDNVEKNRAYRSIDGWQRYLFSQGMTLKQKLLLHEGDSESLTLMHFQKMS